jgi:hypothetical protein
MGLAHSILLVIDARGPHPVAIGVRFEEHGCPLSC